MNIIEKKRSTHACTHNCAAQWAKYSRRLLSILAQQTKKRTRNKRWRLNCLLFRFVCVSLLKRLVKRRKKRSTHACTHNCAAQRTQYSRRLLSILAQHKHKNNKKKKKWNIDALLCKSLDDLMFFTQNNQRSTSRLMRL